ncbi:Hypothetical predicted protein [Xyrichtys novacula]|uniref:Uncharacterized protein n=1 Tax=Xyrichtys novacula TaxID=13765 RepID=A0AAV1GY76_XYRNO|nr:Hypothetical predicted protein [Xyrichtys novacula]
MKKEVMKSSVSKVGQPSPEHGGSSAARGRKVAGGETARLEEPNYPGCSLIRSKAGRLMGGRSAGNRSTWSKPTQTQGEHANSTQKRPGPRFEPRTFLL